MKLFRVCKIIQNCLKMSLYGRLNERKLNENDYVLSCEKTREELSQYIDHEAKRVNVDSAKKRAVLQHMDYEGFRQMVLGANIFPTKSKQLYVFTKGDNAEIMANKYFDQKKSRQQIELERKVQGKSEMHCVNFREFKKKFMSSYSKQATQQQILSCYKQKLKQNQERLRKIFNSDCEGNILVKVAEVFQTVILSMQKQEVEGLQIQAGFILFFFKIIAEIPTMTEMTLLILSKKQKQKISSFIFDLKRVLPEMEEQIERVGSLMSK